MGRWRFAEEFLLLGFPVLSRAGPRAFTSRDRVWSRGALACSLESAVSPGAVDPPGPSGSRSGPVPQLLPGPGASLHSAGG